MWYCVVGRFVFFGGCYFGFVFFDQCQCFVGVVDSEQDFDLYFGEVVEYFFVIGFYGIGLYLQVIQCFLVMVIIEQCISFFVVQVLEIGLVWIDVVKGFVVYFDVFGYLVWVIDVVVVGCQVLGYVD